MRFLLDVHVSTAIAKALVTAGHDVVRAALRFPTMADDELLPLAVHEKLIIVTQDSDFSDLIFALGHPAPPALIFIRCSPVDQPNMAERVLETIAEQSLSGHIAVVTPFATRRRPFPEADNDHD